MCDARGSESGLKGAPCWALAVLVRARHPRASIRVVQDYENLMTALIEKDRQLNTMWFYDPVATVKYIWNRDVLGRDA